MSWAVAIWKERINGNFEEVDGVVPSKWVNEKEKILWWLPGLYVIKKQNTSSEPHWKKHGLIRVELTSGTLRHSTLFRYYHTITDNSSISI